jgi:hypothetical protein
VFSLEGVGEDVAQFRKGCERLLSALAHQTKFSETEKDMISYYCREIMIQTQSLQDRPDK